MADAWPYAVKKLPDGALEYSYDLTAIKAAQGSIEAHEAHGDLAVENYLKTVPRDVKVRVGTGGLVELSAGRGPEWRPMATAFSLVNEGAFENESALGKKGGARLRTALHPDEPKLLLTAEALAWQVRALEESALAAADLDTEWLRREVWGKVAERATARFKTATGDEREGALTLAARALAAVACLDATRLPEAVRNEPEVLIAAQAEIDKLAQEPDLLSPPAPWSWSPELTCARVRGRVLGLPLEKSRGGTAAVLVFFDLLAKDPKLKGLDARVRARRDRFLGPPLEDRLKLWEAQVKGETAKALESLSDFIASLPIPERTPPALLADASTPFGRFLSGLTGSERAQAWDELAAAVQDGRVAPEGETWPVAREAELAAFMQGEGKTVVLSSSWRDQLKHTFALLQGGSVEVRPSAPEPEPEQGERSAVRIRLMVPPLLEVEPLPEAFARMARSLDALADALVAENLQQLRGLSQEGRRGEVLLTEARRLSPRLKALAVLANPDARGDAKELVEARRFLATWRAEPGLARDVRGATASSLSSGGERSHAVVVGLTRRELTATFATPPTVEVLGTTAVFELETGARQRYLVPELKSVAVSAPSGVKPLDRATVRTLVDGVERDPTRVDEVIVQSLKP